MSDHLTSRNLHDALREHARLTAGTGSSYQDVAREIGSIVLAVAVSWVVIGAPGVPAVERWVAQEAEPRSIWAVLAGVVVVLAFSAGQSLSDPLGAILRSPLTALARLIRAAVLLCGVAVIGAVALVPGAYLVHLLNLN